MAIVGRNGCGKTTLIKALLGLVAPSAGKVAWGGGVKHAYFNGVLEGLDPDDTVTHNVNVHGDAYGAPRKAVNRFIRMFGFSEASLGDRIGDLSGGQRARVAVIKCMISGCNAIVMDEPTNHLDIPSIQAMEYGLVSFPGSVLFASHDAFFIDKVATRVLVYEGGSFEGYGGNLTAYRNRPT
ncbi:MAG: ATP-binding cassette domain-containing protein [Oscillospiraceae bacterium]|nr:ATP-binding cassette domain-containing protein [Oscillospiraceae bacterium]